MNSIQEKTDEDTGMTEEKVDATAMEKLDKSDVCNERTSFTKLFVANWYAVVVYCSLFWSFGMSVAFLGPTLHDLGCQTASDMQAMSWLFFAQLICLLVGATASGFLVQRFAPSYIVMVSSAILPVAMFLVPFCREIVTLAILLGVMGLNMGCIDCMANLQMIHIFGEDVSPFLQALHFCYGVGAFVSPMIAEPFLLNTDCSVLLTNPSYNDSDVTEAPSGEYDNTTMVFMDLEAVQESTQVHYAFWIMGALQVPVPFLVLILITQMRRRGWTLYHKRLFDAPSSTTLNVIKSGQNTESYPSVVEESLSEPLEENNSRLGSVKLQLIVITTTTAIITFLYDGLQSAYGGYVYSYALKNVPDMSPSEGAYLNASFWGSFALGRLLSIGIATRFAPVFMLLINIVGSLLSLILVIVLQHDHLAVYVGTCMLGLFISSVTPTAISLAEQYIDVTSFVATVIVVIAATGEMTSPVIVGNMFSTLGPSSFFYCCFVMAAISVIVFVVLVLVGRASPKHKTRNKTNSYIWCRACCLRSDGVREEDRLMPQTVKYYTGDSTANGASPSLELGSSHKPTAFLKPTIGNE